RTSPPTCGVSPTARSLPAQTDFFKAVESQFFGKRTHDFTLPWLAIALASLHMLRELAVQNLALIEDVRVELEPGFCAWTGETGAGKTLLLEALGLLLGERGSAELLRAGTDELRVTGRFELGQAKLREEIGRILDAPLGDDEVIL